jgi:non-ribosomal peptide synthetase component E (peptide arylation enzyme)
MPDAMLGERCCAFIVLADGASPDSASPDSASPDSASPIDVAALRTHLAALGVAKFKYPERVEIRPELPMTSVTKLNKTALRTEIATLLAAEGRP